jgi:hypothetical protein
VSISRDGDELRDGTGPVGTFSQGRIALANRHFTWELLEEISAFMKKMSEPKIVADQVAIGSTAEDAKRPEVISRSGRNLFCGVVGLNSKLIGSIEDGAVFPVFVAAPDVAFTREELLQIVPLLRQAEAAHA